MRTITPAPVRRSVEVKTSVEHAFEVFTAGFGSWWPHSHTIGKGKLKTAVIEPHVGGRWYGEDEDGATAEWGKVLAFEPPSRVLLAWQISDQWRFDPQVMTEVEIRFTPIAAELTRVELEHRYLERLGPDFEKARASMDSPEGWGGIMQLYAAAAEAA
jgi:uncharacterized protein YndB with AHSA1/START domain